MQKETLFYEEILIISIIFDLGSLILLSAKQGSVYMYMYIYRAKCKFIGDLLA